MAVAGWPRPAARPPVPAVAHRRWAVAAFEGLATAGAGCHRPTARWPGSMGADRVPRCRFPLAGRWPRCRRCRGRRGRSRCEVTGHGYRLASLLSVACSGCSQALRRHELFSAMAWPFGRWTTVSSVPSRRAISTSLLRTAECTDAGAAAKTRSWVFTVIALCRSGEQGRKPGVCAPRLAVDAVCGQDGQGRYAGAGELDRCALVAEAQRHRSIGRGPRRTR